MRLLLSELRLAVRAWMHRPGLALTAIATLSLGLGASTAIWSLVHAVLLTPLPYDQPGRMAVVFNAWKGFEKTWVNPGEMLALKRGAPSIEDVAYWSVGYVNVSNGEDSTRVAAGRVSASSFGVLGVKPVLGRAFTAEEDVEGGPSLVILSHEIFAGQFEGDPGIVGRSVRIDGRPFEVVGVMPPGFQLPTDYTADAADPTRVYMPRAASAEELVTIDDSHGDNGALRMRPGASIATINSELKTVVDLQTKAGQHDPTQNFSTFAILAADEIEGPHRLTLGLLAGSSLLLLFIACANVAHLLLGRAEARQAEMSVRMALGASLWRVATQLFAEGLILALAASAIGSALASLALAFVRTAFPLALARSEAARVDLRALAVTIGLAVLTSVVCAVLPGLNLLKTRLVEGLSRASLRMGGSPRQRRVRRGLVAAQLAFAALLSVGGLLIAFTVNELGKIDVGFDPENVLTARVRLPSATYATAQEVNAYYSRLLEGARALPEVGSAGLIRNVPLGESIGDRGITVAGVNGVERSQADWQSSSDGTVATLRERLKAGREFLASDVETAPQVAIVNEAMVRRFWPGLDPIGQRFRIGGETAPWVSVVGVVGDVKHNGLLAPVKSKFYRPYGQFHLSTGSPSRNLVLLVRTTGDPAKLKAPLEALARRLDPQIPLASVRTLESVVGISTANPRFARALLFAFGGLALLLCAIGVYGALAAMVEERRREIGIRRALGASTPNVVRLVAVEMLAMSLSGVAIGLVAAALSSKLIEGLLFGVKALDPALFLGAGAFLLVVAALAASGPALKACAIDPGQALRDE
jgi:putative ABC transport system permease protein